MCNRFVRRMVCNESICAQRDGIEMKVISNFVTGYRWLTVDACAGWLISSTFVYSQSAVSSDEIRYNLHLNSIPLSTDAFIAYHSAHKSITHEFQTLIPTYPPHQIGTYFEPTILTYNHPDVTDFPSHHHPELPQFQNAGSSHISISSTPENLVYYRTIFLISVLQYSESKYPKTTDVTTMTYDDGPSIDFQITPWPSN
jgi:hypothetical protein